MVEQDVECVCCKVVIVIADARACCVLRAGAHNPAVPVAQKDGTAADLHENKDNGLLVCVCCVCMCVCVCKLPTADCHIFTTSEGMPLTAKEL